MTTTTETLRAAIEAALRRRDPEASVSVLPERQGKYGNADPLALAMVNGGDVTMVRATEADALRALAIACGLRVETCGSCGGRGQRLYTREVEDGCDACECAGVVVVDPAEEVARLTTALDDANNLASCQRDTIDTLTRALHDAADRLGCADYDDVCAAVADALDDAERREREHVDEANALRMERASLRAEVARLDDATRGALDDLAKARAELDALRFAVGELLAARLAGLKACLAYAEASREEMPQRTADLTAAAARSDAALATLAEVAR